MKAVMVGRNQGKTAAATFVGLTALELAAGRSCGLLSQGNATEVPCSGCGNTKRLHGVWVFQKWYCPFCVEQLGIKQS